MVLVNKLKEGQRRSFGLNSVEVEVWTVLVESRGHAHSSALFICLFAYIFIFVKFILCYHLCKVGAIK